jgi:hypothetical protein
MPGQIARDSGSFWALYVFNGATSTDLRFQQLLNGSVRLQPACVRHAVGTYRPALNLINLEGRVK